MDKWKTPVRQEPEESKLSLVVFWIACALAGFALPTAIAIWVGWLDPIL